MREGHDTMTNPAKTRDALPLAGRETLAVIERGWPAGTNAPTERGQILFLSASGAWEGEPGSA
jgi:hypothetical protein